MSRTEALGISSKTGEREGHPLNIPVKGQRAPPPSSVADDSIYCLTEGFQTQQNPRVSSAASSLPKS